MYWLNKYFQWFDHDESLGDVVILNQESAGNLSIAIHCYHKSKTFCFRILQGKLQQRVLEQNLRRP